MNPKVSVIIPSYNRAHTLPRALDSVLEQKNVAFELLVIDDGSTDTTQPLIESRYPQVSYHKQSNQGPSAARNRGIERSRGEWIAFLDSDDQWLPGKLETQLRWFFKNPEYRIMQTEEIWIRHGVRVNPLKKHKKYGGWVFEKCLPLCLISPSAVMIHKTVFEEVGLFDESLPACEDYDLWLRISAKNPVGLLEEFFLNRYGGHEDQTSSKYPVMDRFRIYSLAKIIKSGTLSPEQTELAKTVLEEKGKIVIQGALKRGKTTEAEEIQKLIAPFLNNKSFSELQP